jgi:5'-deoxynucleotidase YfbR-like HD superfamily hydrolase
MSLDRTLYALPDWCDHEALGQMQAIRQAGGVMRYHTEPFIPPQSNAQHSWNVAMLARQLWPNEPHLLLAALLHDTGEVRGDLPAPSKWRNAMLKEASNIIEHEARQEIGTQLFLTADEQFKLKFVDYLEACWYCTELRLAGNQHATVIFNRLLEAINTVKEDKRIPELGRQWLFALRYIHIRKG